MRVALSFGSHWTFEMMDLEFDIVKACCLIGFDGDTFIFMCDNM